MPQYEMPPMKLLTIMSTRAASMLGQPAPRTRNVIPNMRALQDKCNLAHDQMYTTELKGGDGFLRLS